MSTSCARITRSQTKRKQSHFNDSPILCNEESRPSKRCKMNLSRKMIRRTTPTPSDENSFSAFTSGSPRGAPFKDSNRNSSPLKGVCVERSRLQNDTYNPDKSIINSTKKNNCCQMLDDSFDQVAIDLDLNDDSKDYRTNVDRASSPPLFCENSCDRLPALTQSSTTSSLDNSLPLAERFRQGCFKVAQKCDGGTQESQMSTTSECGLNFTSKSDDDLAFLARSANLVNTQDLGTDTPPLITDHSFHGLPDKVKQLLDKYRGIKQLFDWQTECLSLEAVRNRENLIYSLPTSGGKTLVAEMLVWKEVMIGRKDVLLIFPYIAIVQEKVRDMSPFALELDFVVEEYAGSKGAFPPRKRRKRSVYMATMEKAGGLVNSLIESDRIEELGLVVVDELHMIGESKRGAVLESTLTKLMFLEDSNFYIIGMSATLGNIDDLRKFLKAELYTRDFRPVELLEYVKMARTIYGVNPSNVPINEKLKPVRVLDNRSDKLNGTKVFVKDPDHIGQLVGEVIPKSSCLVFCPSKKNCENVAKLICDVLPLELRTHNYEAKEMLYKALLAEGGGRFICPVLSKTIVYGVAYHHSGLTADERTLIEEGFLNGTLCCLTCTSTLAAGVNLPAKRVILRSPYVGADFLTRSRYMQMIGRAGRMGFDTVGESFLIVSNQNDQRKLRALFEREEKVVCASALVDNVDAINALIISALGSGLAKTRRKLIRLIERTLLFIQTQDKFRADHVVDQIVRDLKQRALISKSRKRILDELGEGLVDDDLDLEVTDLGRATFKGGISVDLVPRLVGDLRKALSCLNLTTYIHLLFLVTPYDSPQSIKMSSAIFTQSYAKLGTDELKAAELLGINESVLTRIAIGQQFKSEDLERTVHRFYVTLMLYDVWRGSVDIQQVAEKFQVPRGHVQNVLSSAVAFASCLLHFCQELKEFWALQELLLVFNKRLSYCAANELVPLMDLPAVKQGRAKQLYDAGYRSLQDVAQAKANDLVNSVHHLPKKTAMQIISAAKMLLMERVEALQEEADEMAASVRNAPPMSSP